MHILFVHKNHPAQFGHLAEVLVQKAGTRCTFVSERPPGLVGGVELIQYATRGGATRDTHFCSRSFENGVWHAHAVFEALKARPDIRPDLIVGHSGFGSTLFLRELHDVPIINYFEFYYHAKGSDLDFRPDFPSGEMERLRAEARNAMLLLDLENCAIGYSPTEWQRSLFPASNREKIRVIFDGVDTRIWQRRAGILRSVMGRAIPDDMKIITYATRGMESLRGFDLFMKAARLIARRRKDVLFVVVGEDRVCYGGDERFTGGKSFKEWVLSNDDYDLSRFLFIGTIPAHDLAALFSITDLHYYLTGPFVLSWSLMNAMACGSTIVASDTAPVREMIQHETNGLLVDFFDIEGMADLANQVLDHLAAYQTLGRAAETLIRERYSLDACLPRHQALFEEAARLRRETSL